MAYLLLFRNAGLGLALLYMTVLGFDNITYGTNFCEIYKTTDNLIYLRNIAEN